MKVELVKNKLVVRFDYNPDLVTKVKTLSGRAWNPRLKIWTVPYLQKSAQKLKDWGFEIDDGLVNNKKETLKFQKPMRIQVPSLKKVLYPFQEEGVGFIESRKGRVLLGDEMGLGKSCQSIAWITTHPEIKKVLIICPNSVKLTWFNEIKKWTDCKALVIQGNQQQRETLYKKFQKTPEVRYLIVNYDVISTDLSFIQNL